MMRRMLTISTVIIISSIAPNACSSPPLILKGRVTDQSGLAIKGASVRTEPYTDSVSTNQSGHFFINRRLVNQGQDIKSLKAGSYHLIIESSGYHTLTLPIKLDPKITKKPKHIYVLRRDRVDFNPQAPTKKKTITNPVNHIHDGPKSGPP